MYCVVTHFYSQQAILLKNLGLVFHGFARARIGILLHALSEPRRYNKEYRVTCFVVRTTGNPDGYWLALPKPEGIAPTNGLRCGYECVLLLVS